MSYTLLIIATKIAMKYDSFKFLCQAPYVKRQDPKIGIKEYKP